MNKYSKEFFAKQGKIGAKIGNKIKKETSTPKQRSEWAKQAWVSRRANLTKGKI